MDGEEYYPESGEETQASQTQAPPAPEEMETEEGNEDEYEGEGKETTIPLSLFSNQELSPGQTITLKVVRLLDTEAVVAPVGKEKSSPMSESMASLEGMAE